MADAGSSYVPAELNGQHYRPIGGTYESFEKAIQATEQHFRNRHGGPGSIQIFKLNPEHGPALVEVGTTNNDPLAVRTIYKILEQPPAR